MGSFRSSGGSNLAVSPASGAWVKMNSAPATQALNEANPIFTPMPVGPMTISAVAIDCQGAADTGIVRIALFNTINGLPGISLVEGVLNCTTTGIKQLAVNVGWSGGIIWLAVVSQSSTTTPATLRVTGDLSVPLVCQNADIGTSWSNEFLMDLTAVGGSFPSPYPVARLQPFGQAAPAFALRAA